MLYSIVPIEIAPLGRGPEYIEEEKDSKEMIRAGGGRPHPLQKTGALACLFSIPAGGCERQRAAANLRLSVSAWASELVPAHGVLLHDELHVDCTYLVVRYCAARWHMVCRTFLRFLLQRKARKS